MTLNEPKVNPVSRYSITKTANLLEVTSRTVHNWINAVPPKIKVKYRKVDNKPFITGLEILRVWNQTHS